MDKALLKELSEAVSTPSYIFDLDLFRERAAMVKRYFSDTIGLCYSIKANPFFLKELPETFDHIEVCSPGELTICERLKTDMSKVIFSGVNKTQEDIERRSLQP